MRRPSPEISHILGVKVSDATSPIFFYNTKTVNSPEIIINNNNKERKKIKKSPLSETPTFHILLYRKISLLPLRLKFR